jgi:hypothetical protein
MKPALAILFRPGAAAAILRRRPRWLQVFAVLCACHLLLAVAVQSHSTALVVGHLPASASATDRAYVSVILADGFLQRCMFLPIRLLTGWSAYAGVLFLLARSVKPPAPAPFLCFVALEIHAEIILLMDRVVTSAYGILAMPQYLSPVSPLSVAAFVESAAPLPIFFLLGRLNFFTLWYVAAVASGIRVLCGLTIRTSALVAVGAWVLSEFFNSGILTLLIRALHLQV